MKLSQVAIPLADDADAQNVYMLLRELRVPMDPCAGEPRVRTGPAGQRELLVIITAGVRAQLDASGRRYAVVHDFADEPDPRTYVSPTNRYADVLARLRSPKPGR